MQDGNFRVKDDDRNIPNNFASIFTPGEKNSNYKISIMPKSGEPIIPMTISSGSGTNLREVTIEIIPDDKSDSTEVTVCISIIIIITFLFQYL